MIKLEVHMSYNISQSMENLNVHLNITWKLVREVSISKQCMFLFTETIWNFHDEFMGPKLCCHINFIEIATQNTHGFLLRN